MDIVYFCQVLFEFFFFIFVHWIFAALLLPVSKPIVEF